MKPVSHGDRRLELFNPGLENPYPAIHPRLRAKDNVLQLYVTFYPLRLPGEPEQVGRVAVLLRGFPLPSGRSESLLSSSRSGACSIQDLSLNYSYHLGLERPVSLRARFRNPKAPRVKSVVVVALEGPENVTLAIKSTS